MKDLIAKLKSEANVALGAIWLHIDAQAARIAELEAQIAAASAPEVEQKPIARLTTRDKPSDLFDIIILDRARCKDGMALYAAPQAADTDKLREAILEIHVILPSGYDEREVSAFKAGAKATSDAALKVLASTALQAPVGDGIANDTEAGQAILDGNRLQAPVREVPVWLPIEGAPKDGREVLLWLPAPYNRIAKARWFDLWENWQEGEFPSDNDEYCGIGSKLPTHYMPLPAAPVQKGGE